MNKKITNLFRQLKTSSFYETFTDISTYFSAQIAIQALGIVSLPLYTYFLDADDYGIVNVYISYATVFAILLGANLFGAVSRYYYEEKPDFKEFMGTTIISSLLVFAWSSLLVFVFRESIAEYINLPKEVIVYLLGFSFITAVFSVFQQIFVPQKKSKLFATTQVVFQYMKFGGAVLGLYWVTEHIYMGKIVGELIAMISVLFFLIYKIAPFVKMRFSLAHLKYITHYVFPLIPFILSGFILHSFDQWFINASLGHSDAGLYTFAYKIGIILAGFITSLLSGSNPDYYKWMNRQEYEKINDQVISLLKLLTIATGFMILFAVDLGTLLSSRAIFREALPIVPVIIAGYFLFGIAQFYNRAIYFLKKNIYLTYIVMTAGILNILMNYYYVPMYGYHAAAYTTLAAYFVMSLLSWFTTVYVLKLPPLPMKRILFFVSILVGLISCYYLFFDEIGISIGRIFLKGILFFIFAGIIYYHNIRKLIVLNKN